MVAEIDAFSYRYQYSLDKSDLRVLTTWKLGIEKLRCAILGVSISYTASDTVVTPIQLFFLRFSRLGAAFARVKRKSFFPEWSKNNGL